MENSKTASGNAQNPNEVMPSSNSRLNFLKDKKNLLIVTGVAFLLVIFIVIFNLFRSKQNDSTAGEIVWWGLWEDETSISPLITEFQSKNPDIIVKYVKQSKEDYRERLTNALAKGTGPDIFRFHNTWVPMFKSELDSVPPSVYSATDFALKFYPVALSDLSLNSSVVGIPLMYDGLSLYINEEIFEKSGKEIPTTWNELRQTARELTIKDEKNFITQSGVALGRTENVDHWPEILGLMMLQNGVDLTDPTGRLAEDAINFFTIFTLDDGVWDVTLPNSTVAFASGKVAMYFGPSWRAFEIRLQNPNLRFKTVPVPQLPKTEANEIDVTYASYWIEGVWSKSKNKQAAWKFLKFMSEKETLEKFYNNSSKQRMFGEPYPRTDMEAVLSSHPIIGSTVSQAKYAQSWYLQSRTWDGPTGINTQINKYFEDAINGVNQGKQTEKVLETVASGVQQVLSQYGIKVQ